MNYMKGIVIIFFFINISLFAQRYVTEKGEFMDTTSIMSLGCETRPSLYYYSLGAKYPESSATLVQKAQSFLQIKGHNYTGSGYINFRFVIDCEGKMKACRISQTDEQYKTTHFDATWIEELYLFLQTLDKWKKATHPQSKTPINYYAYLTFIVKNGKIINVIP